MTPSPNAYKLIKGFEGCVLHAYKDVAGIWTIGFGNTFYEDGTTVKQGDKITREQAEKLLVDTVNRFAGSVDKLIKQPVTQNQFDSLVSFSYNVGLGALKNSTLLRLVNKNPNDPLIKAEFTKWKRAGGKVVDALVKRRLKESENYYL